jgi:hypothetical protein
MKRLLALALLLSAPSAFATTWYVRTDGGTPYVNGTQTPHGQCTGLSNAAYSGVSQRWQPQTSYALNTQIADEQGYVEKVTTAGISGTAAVPAWSTTTSDGTVTWTRQSTYPINQSCAMGKLKYLWADMVTGSQHLWMIAGGDTVNIAAGAYTDGYENAWGLNDPNCAGDAAHCSMPLPPIGTSGQHTRFIGQGNSFSGTPTIIRGSWGEETVFQMRDATAQPLYIDVTGLEISGQSACGKQGQVHGCTGSVAVSSGSVTASVATFTYTLPSFSITAISVTSNFGTFTTTAGLSITDTFLLEGCTTTALNGQVVTVSNVISAPPPLRLQGNVTLPNNASAGTCTGYVANPVVTGETFILGGFTATPLNNQFISAINPTATSPSGTASFQANVINLASGSTGSGTATVAENFITNGFEQDNRGGSKTYTNVYVHGTAGNGVYGTMSNDTVNGMWIIANASGGFEMDDQGAFSTVVGTNVLNNLIIRHPGCTEQWPKQYPATGSVGDCTDDSYHGGYGDAIGTADSSNAGSTIICNQCEFSYSTQDGMDLLHFYKLGECIRCLAYGNMGNQLKFGGPSLFQNDYAVGNCYAMTYPAFGPFTADYNKHLSDFCRAGGSTIVMRVDDGFTPVPAIIGNTILAKEGLIGLEVDSLTSCTAATCAVNYRDNVFLGATAAGTVTPIYMAGPPLSVFNNTGGSNSYNSTFGQNTACPYTSAYETHAICTDPGLVNETWPNTGYNNVVPASGASAIVGSGITISGLTVDYTGTTRPSPPSMGAYEFATNPSTSAFFGGSAVISGLAAF